VQVADVWSTMYTPCKQHATYTTSAVHMMHVSSPCVHTLGNRFRGLSVAALAVFVRLGGDCTGWVHRHRLRLSIRAPKSCKIMIKIICQQQLLGKSATTPCISSIDPAKQHTTHAPLYAARAIT